MAQTKGFYNKQSHATTVYGRRCNSFNEPSLLLSMCHHVSCDRLKGILKLLSASHFFAVYLCHARLSEKETTCSQPPAQKSRCFLSKFYSLHLLAVL